MNELQAQVASGKETQRFSGIANNASKLVNLKSELKQAEQFIENITITEKRLDLMAFAIEEIEKIARKARTDLAGTLNGSTADDLEVPSVMQAARDQVIELLNMKDDSRFLFAGGEIETRPVDISNGTYTTPVITGPPNPSFNQTVDTGYYEGDSAVQSTRIDDNFTVSYGILANESAFEKLIRTLDNIAAHSFSDPVNTNEQTFIKAAMAELTEVIENNGTDKTLTDFRSDIGLDRVMLDSIKGKHSDFLNFAQDSIAEIENVDTAEAVALLNFEQIQLEASFTTIARIQTLSLSNFLR
ncbi:MAG: flagellin [Pseudomonadota bacterium]|nr:flagellin [Pseudomonadota bacterium]